jgi:RNA polymerase sigma-70 factor (ECF subfamily)
MEVQAAWRFNRDGATMTLPPQRSLETRDGRTFNELLPHALEGDSAATRALVQALTLVVHVRVARALLRSGSGCRQGRDVLQEIEDFVQEVFTALFANGARTLRAWDPSRSMSLANYVGMVAENQVASILRSRRRSPWEEEATSSDALALEAGASESAESRVYSREVLAMLMDRLRHELTPLGLRLFRLIVVEEGAVERTCQATAMTPDAVYAWRSRLRKLARKHLDEIMRDAPAGDG